MSSDPESNPADTFAALFESEQKSRPQRGAGRDYRPGESVEGTVIRVGRDAVFVELDGKREGYIEAHEMRDDVGAMTVQLGDKLRAIVVSRADEEGALRLAKSAPRGQGAEGLQRAREAGLPVEGVVSGVNKGGLEVTIDGVRAFCPARQADKGYVEDLATFIGQKLKFLVTAVKEGGREVTVSRRALMEREEQDARLKLQDKLVPGAVLRGRVTSTREFGAFVDLGGVDGLLPNSELSHDRSVRAADMVKIGDELEVQVLRVEPAPDGKKGQKITLSLKAMAGDPWESTALEEGAIREGRVARVAAFGAFVTLAPGLDGLLHVSELSGELDDKGQPVMPKVGETLRVKLLKIDRKEKRVGLGLADAAAGKAGGAAVARKAAPTLSQGATIAGKVSRVESYGVFVQIEGANARGLIPAQELQKAKAGDLHKSWPLGTEVRAKIIAIDAAGKIRLSIAAMKDDEERATFEDFRAKEHGRELGSGSGGGGLGALGEKLKKAGLLGKKK